MFLGVNTLNLDAKGRLAVPVKHRQLLTDLAASRVVVTVNPREHCLWLYPENEWREIERKVSRLPTLKPQNQLLQRFLLGYASELEMDGQGRILLTSELREYAGMDKRVAIVGLGHKFEIWSEAAWVENREIWMAEANQADSALFEGLEDMML